MNDELIDVRTPLAASDNVRIEVGQDGQLYVVTPALTLHLDRAHCEELTNALARAMVRLRKMEAARGPVKLRMIRGARSAGEIVLAAEPDRGH